MQGMNEEKRRIFFGFSVEAPWQSTYPKGRIIAEATRHITFAFLGNILYPPLEKELVHFPPPDFKIGPTGLCDRLLFLPKKEPRVVALHVSWLSGKEKIASFHQTVLHWLESLGYPVDRRPFLPHITIARAPFEEADWEKTFEKLPTMITGIHLYESLGGLHYQTIWKLPLLPPFEEFEHTADIGFHVRGNSLQELYHHGALAMSFKFPPFLSFIKQEEIQDIQDIIRLLNKKIAECDLEIGCPFKAVSYHGKIRIDSDQMMHWEMIVDV